AGDEEMRARLGRRAHETLLERHTVERRQREFETIVDGPRQPPRTTFPRPEPSLVSVVMPVRNEEENIGEQLAALADQIYPGAWEVVVVDDGCTDRSIGIVEKWRPRLPLLRVVRTSRQGLNRARNMGAAAALGDLL